MSADAPDSPVVRPATSADLPRLGMLGALLFEEFHADIEKAYVQLIDATTGNRIGTNIPLNTDPDGDYLSLGFNGTVSRT